MHRKCLLLLGISCFNLVACESTVEPQVNSKPVQQVEVVEKVDEEEDDADYLTLSTTFPDTEFQKWLRANYGDKIRREDLTDEYLDFTGYAISIFDGLNLFQNVKGITLGCDDPVELISFDSRGCKGLNKIKVTNYSFRSEYSLDLSENRIAELSFTNCDLSNLNWNKLSTVRGLTLADMNLGDFSIQVSISKFTADGCTFDSLNTELAEALTEIKICDSELQRIDLSSNMKLKSIECDNLGLEEIALPPSVNLKRLVCSNNKLTSLSINQCPSLTYVNCSNNEINSLDVSQCLKLAKLVCTNNHIPGLYIVGTPLDTTEGALECDRGVTVMRGMYN